MPRCLQKRWWWRKPPQRSPRQFSNSVSCDRGECTGPRPAGAAGRIQHTPSLHPTDHHIQPGKGLDQTKLKSLLESLKQPVTCGSNFHACGRAQHRTCEGSSCDLRRLDSWGRQGVAKRSWLRSDKPILWGEPGADRCKLLGVSCTNERTWEVRGGGGPVVLKYTCTWPISGGNLSKSQGKLYYYPFLCDGRKGRLWVGSTCACLALNRPVETTGWGGLLSSGLRNSS